MLAVAAPAGGSSRRRLSTRALLLGSLLLAVLVLGDMLRRAVRPRQAVRIMSRAAVNAQGRAEAAMAPPTIATAATASVQQQQQQEGLPADRVALMFLTRGPMPLAPVWDEWLSAVDGLLAAPQLGYCSSGNGQLQPAQPAVTLPSSGGGDGGASVYKRQHLFNIYVHAPPSYSAPYSNSSVFHGREVQQRIATRWGTHSLVTAVRHMLREALEDPRNQRFVLLSESDIPLWPAGLTYLQLMAEPLSRASYCAPSNKTEMASIDREGAAKLLGFAQEQWRKNSQWFVINRKHAQLYVDDTEIDARFSTECFVRKDIVHWKARPDDRWCVSDEHYLSVLLAARGEEPNLSCSVSGGQAELTYTEWGTGPHPRTFKGNELGADTITWARNCTADSADKGLRSYSRLLVPVAQWNETACHAAATTAEAEAEAGADPPAAVAAAAEAGSAAPLPLYSCLYFLRKAASDVVDPLLRMMQQEAQVGNSQSSR